MLVFSNFTRMLRIIEAYMMREQVRLRRRTGIAAGRCPVRSAPGSLAPTNILIHPNSLRLCGVDQYDYLYLDGSSTSKQRQAIADTFNTRCARPAARGRGRACVRALCRCSVAGRALSLLRERAPCAAHVTANDIWCIRKPATGADPQAERVCPAGVQGRRRRGAQPHRRKPRGGV